jgi:TonB family protein
MISSPRAVSMLHLTLAFVLLQTVAQATPLPSPPQAPVRVGGPIKPPVKTRDVRPRYPEAAQAAAIEGVVILEVTIGVDGTVTDAKILRSIPLLDTAAIDAVRQWTFTPTVMPGSGQPIPVIMTVTVNFTLGGDLTPHACAEETALLPKDDAPIVPTTITFTNRGAQRKLLRLTPLGRSPSMLVLDVDEKYEQTSIPGEPWMIADMNGVCQAIYVATPGRSTVTIR